MYTKCTFLLRVGISCEHVQFLKFKLKNIFINAKLFREEAEGRSSSDMLAEVLQESSDDVFNKDTSLSPAPGGQG